MKQKIISIFVYIFVFLFSLFLPACYDCLENEKDLIVESIIDQNVTQTVELSLKNNPIRFLNYQEVEGVCQKNEQHINPLQRIFEYERIYKLKLKTHEKEINITAPFKFILTIENNTPHLDILYISDKYIDPDIISDESLLFGTEYKIYSYINKKGENLKFYTTGTVGAYLIVPSEKLNTFFIGGTIFINIKNINHDIEKIVPFSIYHCVTIIDDQKLSFLDFNDDYISDKFNKNCIVIPVDCKNEI